MGGIKYISIIVSTQLFTLGKWKCIVLQFPAGFVNGFQIPAILIHSGHDSQLVIDRI